MLMMRRVLLRVAAPHHQRGLAEPGLRSLVTSARARVQAEQRQGSTGGGAASVTVGDREVRVDWGDGSSNAFSFIWLQDHSPAVLHPTSRQRMIDTVSIDPTEAPEAISVKGNELHLSWKSSREANTPPTIYNLDWLRANAYGGDASDSSTASTPRATGAAHQASTAKTKASGWSMLGPVSYVQPKTWYGPELPLQSFDAREDSHDAQRAVLETLLRDGLVHLHHMPEGRDALRAVFQRFGMLRRTFYADDIWDLRVVADADVNDTAMTTIELPPHTDCTYHAMPPGLQLFSCLQNRATGGESWFVDGRAIYDTLARESPEAADFFATTVLPFYCIEDGIYLCAEGKVFTLDANKQLTQFRYNNSDRGPLAGMPAHVVDAFYTHLPVLTRVMLSDELALLKRVKDNEMVVVDNHRCLHARKAFQGARSFVGAYIDMDHFHSQCRLHGLELARA